MPLVRDSIGRRAFLRAAAALAAAGLAGCSGRLDSESSATTTDGATPLAGPSDAGTRPRLRAGTTGWYRNWSPDVVVETTDDNATAQSKIDANPGGTIGFASGTHVERKVTPAGSGQRLIGRADGTTRFDGSRDLGTAGWSGRGPWGKAVPGGIVRRGERMDDTEFWGTRAAQRPEDLWVKTGTEEAPLYVGGGGWRRLQRVESPDAVTTGTWHLDYATGVVTVGDDPARYDEVRIATTDLAVTGRRFPVLIADLWIDKYATWIRDAPLGKQPMHRNGWMYHYVTVSGSHAIGIGVSPGTLVRNCLSRHNGRYGVSGNDWGDQAFSSGARFDIQDSRFTRNLLLDYNGRHGGGGSKFGVQSTDTRPSLIVNCWFDHNNHHGIWFDGNWRSPNTAHAEVRSNLVERNASRGLTYEVSHLASCLVRSNRFARNGVGEMPGNAYGPSARREGLFVNSSANLHFVENVVEDNERGIRLHDTFPGREVPLRNVRIEGNEISAAPGGTAGRLQWWSYDAAHTGGFRLRNCAAEGNAYHIASASSDDFRYDLGDRQTDFAGWQDIRPADARMGSLDGKGSIDNGPVGTPTNFVPFRESFYGAGSGLDA